MKAGVVSATELRKRIGERGAWSASAILDELTEIEASNDPEKRPLLIELNAIPERASEVLAAHYGMDRRIARALLDMLIRWGRLDDEPGPLTMAERVWEWCRVDGAQVYVSKYRTQQAQRAGQRAMVMDGMWRGLAT